MHNWIPIQENRGPQMRQEQNLNDSNELHQPFMYTTASDFTN